MPIVGQDRKARMHTVRNAYRDAPNGPRPHRNETFKHFLKRMLAETEVENADPILTLLVLLGIDEPNQRVYLDRLQDACSFLREINFAVYKAWNK